MTNRNFSWVRAFYFTAFAIASIAVSPAQAQVIGDEQTINQDTSGFRAMTWDVCADVADGTGVAVWQSGSAFGSDNGQDLSGASVIARRMDADGTPLSFEFFVNSTTEGDQAFPVVRMMDGGGFAIAWSDRPNDSSAWNTKARVFNADGSPLSGEFDVPQSTGGSQYAWDLVRHPEGEFTVIWASYPNLPNGNRNARIFGRRFFPNGNANGNEFQINEGGADLFLQPNASLGDGDGFIVAWSRGALNSGTLEMFARSFDVDGNAISGQFQVDDSTTAEQSRPVVETDGSRAMASWIEIGQNRNVKVRELDRSGGTIGDPVTIATVDGTGAASSSLASLGDGRFAVVFTEENSSFVEDIRARVVGTDTTQLGSTFEVVTRAGEQGVPYGPTARPTGTAGEFIVVWPDGSRGALGDDVVAATIGCDDEVCPASAGQCGDPLFTISQTMVSGDASVVLASDALFVLQAALGLATCETCVCDADGNGSVTASDALAVLTVAVGGDFTLACPPCGG